MRAEQRISLKREMNSMMSGMVRKGVVASLMAIAGLLAAMPVVSQTRSGAVMASGNTNQEGQFFRGGVVASSGMAGGRVALPNGKYTEFTEDIRVKVPGGHVKWSRDFNGNQWRFNPNWLSLEFEFDTIVYASSSSSGGGGGGGNMAVLEMPTPPEIFGGTRIPGTNGSLGEPGRNGPLWAISRNGSWFLVDSNSCSFALKSAASSNRFLMKPVFVGEEPACPSNRLNSGEGSQPVRVGSSGGSGGSSGGGSGVVMNSKIFTNPNGGMSDKVAGFRWEDRTADWIDYDRNGRVKAYGDKNNIRVSMQYTGDKLTGIVDNNGRQVLSIVYSGDRIVEVRDVPRAGDPTPARSVKYEYASNGSIHKVTDVRGFVTQYDYDGKDRLEKVTDAEGRVRAIKYGPTNRVEQLIQPDGTATDYEYDYDKVKKLFLARARYPEVNGQRRVEVSLYDTDGLMVAQEVNNRVQRELSQEGRVDRLIDGRGNVTQITRNEFNQVVSVRYADGATLVNQFDPRNMRLLDQRGRDGVMDRYERDASGNLLRRTYAVGTADEQVATYVRDDKQRVQTVTLLGRSERTGVQTPDVTYGFRHDDADNVIEVVDAAGKAATFTHDRQGNLLTETDALGNTWRYTYDADGNLLTSTSPLGHVNSFEYDRVGNELVQVDGRGKTYRSRVDARDRETAVIDPYGSTYSTAYNAVGAVSGVMDASGKGTQFEYDAWTRPTITRDGKGHVYAMDYTGPDGQDTGARQPSKVKYPTFERLFSYNARNRPSQKTDLDGTDGRTEQYTYDAEGRRKSITDASGKTRTFDYDAFGRVTRMTDPLGASMQFAYDVRGNVLEITDANGRKTQFAYDSRELLVSETDPLGKVTRYAYDDIGRSTGTTLANGERSERVYDADGRLTTLREFTAGGALAKTTVFTYDEEDRLLTWSDGRFGSVIAYDDAGRLVSEQLDFGAFRKSRAYTYYPNNQVQTYTGPDGITITYGYDALGQLERVSIPGEGDISVTEWEWAARKTVLLPGGGEQRFEYDGLQMMTRMKVLNPGKATVFELEQKYGRLFEVTEKTLDGVATTYGYDNATRLTSVQTSSAAFNEGYTVDANGNRVSDTRTGSSNWQYDSANQLVRQGTVTYSYDDNGSLVRRVDSAQAEPLRTRTFQYDALKRLSEVRDGAGALVARYEYDPFDRRLSKQVGAAGPVTFFFPSPTGIVGEMDAAGEVKVSYGWHPEHDDSTYPLYARHAQGAGSRYVYYHNDHLGTPHRVTDNTGKLLWSARYDGFGKAAVSVPAEGAVENHLRFPGQYFDQETGLHYNNRRVYDPETGRYLTRDPIGFNGGANLYAYVGHNPVNFTDPTGEILPCLAVNYLRCMAACMLLSSVEDYVMDCGNINWGENAKDCAIECLISMLPIPNPCGKFGKWLGMGMGAAGAMNSFPEDTLVHVTPRDAVPGDAAASRSELRPIGELRPGDEVLALAEWKNQGPVAVADARLSYERITDVFTSKREQRFVRIKLDDGEELTATEGHPFKTTEGWRDAARLERGARLLRRGSEASGSERTAVVVDLSLETKTIQVFNLEVANSHTFFVGPDGVLVHNGIVYCREFPGEPPYIGKADDEKNYKRRQDAHDKKYGRQHTYRELYNDGDGGKRGKDLEKVEQQHLDESGGPNNKSNPNGRTANKRNNVKKPKKGGCDFMGPARC